MAQFAMTVAPAATLPAVADFSAYVREVNRIPILSAQEELEHARDYRKSGNLKAAQMLVYAHLRQVVAIARKYSGYGLDQQDLVQEGNIGLMTAVKKFDPEIGVRLNAYATFWIRSFINEFVIRNWRIVKVATTRAQRKLFFNLRRMTQQLGKKLERSDIKGIADELDVKQSDVVVMNKRMHSYDLPYDSDNADDDQDTSPSATLTSRDGEHQEMILVEKARVSERREALSEALELLDDRERAIIQARGLSESGKDVKLAELGKRMGISSERVRQLEAKAMGKLRTSLMSSKAFTGGYSHYPA